MDIRFVLAISIVLQLAAAALALWLTRITRRRLAWMLIATAITLMAARRAISLFRIGTADVAHPPVYSAELVAVAISAIMLLGLALIIPLFRAIQRSEGALKLTQFTLDHAEEAVFWLTPEGRFEYVNHAACRSLGYSREELLSRGIEDIDPQFPTSVWPETWREVKESGFLRFESHHRRKDGQMFPVEVTANFHEYEKRQYICAFARDMSERTQAVEALREAHDDLERRVAERTSELVDANERLQGEIRERERAERGLRESSRDLARLAEEQFALLQHTRDFVYRHDTNGVFTYLSPAVEQVTGYNIDQWRKHYTEYMTDAAVNESVVANTEETLRTGKERSPYLVEIRHREGRTVMLEVSERPYFERGAVAGIIGVARDVTERWYAEAALRESEQRLQAILDNSPAVIYVKDVTGRYLVMNRRCEEIFGFGRGQAIGKTDHELHPQDVADAFRANDNLVLASGAPVEVEEVAPQADGDHTYISLKFALLDRHGTPNAVCGISTDITERKQASEQLRQARDVAQAANRAKSVFLANISHEMRTPITAMLGAAELLGANQTLETGPRARAEMIVRNGRHLLALIDDLLDLSRAEAGKLEIRCAPCSLVDLIDDVVALTHPQHQRSTVDFRITYETQVPAEIQTDPTRLKQAIVNLINNALKFTETGHVHVRIAVNATDPDPRLSMVVEDTGIGIAEADSERVFETFAQIEPPKAAVYGGVGLGLPLAKWIAEQLGGTLTVSSVLDHGSTFTLHVATGALGDVPWLTPEDHTLTPASRSRANESQPLRHRVRLCGRVLLAEDFRDTRDIIEHALAKHGAEVTPVTNGHEAVSQGSTQAFDLILLDIRMPRMDGLAAAAELRRRGCLTPIIALTASTTESDRKRVLDAGFDELWSKPITIETLLDRTATYLKTSGDDADEDGAAPPPGRVGLDERIAEVAAEFVRALPARLDSVRKAVTIGDLAGAREVLHQLVGAGGLHGYGEISSEAARLLEMAKTGTLADAASELVALSGLVDSALRTVAKSGPNPPPGHFSS